ncbi:DUF4129 domain-containing protein [Leifsonia sp. fls2-241-R2A-40a]|uniref:DUF4129 domain-containing protein n=1 Tax=Leifsonia sp. fls2-241-R2A-40a TaxID=3040290 RepID=UPI00254A2C21|nr:DUF4129 domain-containing protein [Leifsonia sp. fls2-241-R2A-40a]
MHLEIPVDPSSPEAQEWLRDELARPEYQAAKPTWFDVASKAVQDWIASLFQGPGGNGGPLLPLIVLLILAGLIVAAFFIFGRPRRNRRSAIDRRSLFGVEDGRTASDLRAAAERAARSGDWVVAVEEQFRAIAAALDERTLVHVTPGTTATEFAQQAARIAPGEGEALRRAARVFDEVRYLDRPGSEGSYQLLVGLDQRLQGVRVPAPQVVA